MLSTLKRGAEPSRPLSERLANLRARRSTAAGVEKIQVSAADVRDGLVLDKLAPQFAKRLGCMTLKHSGGEEVKQLKVSHGSGCTGSGIDKFVFDAVREGFRSTHGIDLIIVQRFVCEIEERKRNFLMAVHEEDDLCIFIDVRHLEKSRAWCERHRQHCVVPGVDWKSLGFSCKSVSPAAKGSNPEAISVLARKCQKSSTAITFFAGLGYVKRHHPGVLFLENLDNLSDDAGPGENSNLDVVVDCLREEGYEVLPIRMRTSDYGLPQDRLRLYIIAFHSCSELFPEGIVWDNVMKELSDSFELLKCRPPPFLECLLLADDNPCETELTSLIVSKITREEDDLVKHEKWHDLHKDFLKVKKVRWATLQCDADTQASPWYAVLTPRQIEVLAWAQQCLGPLTNADVSQSINWSHAKNPTTAEGVQLISSIMPGMKYWLGNQKRVVLGRELLSLQGFPWQKLPLNHMATFSESLLGDLAGNAYSGTVVLALVCNIFAQVEWRVGPSQQGMQCHSDAMALISKSEDESLAKTKRFSSQMIVGEDESLVSGSESSESEENQPDDSPSDTLPQAIRFPPLADSCDDDDGDDD